MRAIAAAILLAVLPGSALAGNPLDAVVGPCQVNHFDMYEDGGTWGGSLVDAEGRELLFCRDGRMRALQWGEEPDSVDPYLFWVGAMHPTQDGAVPLELGGDREQRLVGILDAWVVATLPEDEYGTVIRAFNEASSYRERTDLIAWYELSEDQGRALWVNIVIEGHRKSRDRGAEN